MIEISKEQAIKVMEENLKILKECSDSDTFLLLSFDLKENKSLGRTRLDLNNGRKLVKNSKTFILNTDSEEDSVSVLSIYTAIQKDILNILPIGKKHDMIIVPQLEWYVLYIGHKIWYEMVWISKTGTYFPLTFSNVRSIIYDVRNVKRPVIIQTMLAHLWLTGLIT